MKNGEGNVLDVGANLGIMTVHLAKELPNSKIHAFEPMPDNQKVLKKIVKHYGLQNVIFHEMALGEKSGWAKMILPTKDGAKMQGLSHVKHDSITEWNEGEECEVPMETLDAICEKCGRIQGIKMDVENFEYFVLKGGKKLIQKNMPIIYIELWENNNRYKCFELLQSFGYKINVAEANRLVPYNPDKHLTQNFIFTAN